MNLQARKQAWGYRKQLTWLGVTERTYLAWGYRKQLTWRKIFTALMLHGSNFDELMHILRLYTLYETTVNVSDTGE